MQFSDDECYELFLAVDDRCRQLGVPPPSLIELREKLLPVYRKRHGNTSGAENLRLRNVADDALDLVEECSLSREQVTRLNILRGQLKLMSSER